MIKADEILIQNGKPLSRLPPRHGLRSFSVGERIKGAKSILKLANLITPEEVEVLKTSCLEAAEDRKQSKGADQYLEQGNKGVFVRLLTQACAEREESLEDALPKRVSEMLDTALERAFTYLDSEVCSSVKTTLFGDDANTSIAQLFRDNRLEYSIREPAINVYEAPQGHFAMHKDHHALSILINLSDPKTDFEGGGTAFWSQSHPMEGMDRPSLVLKPPPGTAMLWGGRVSHKGLHITEGTRVVFVASFSGPGSPKEEVRDRLSAGMGIKTILSGR